MGVTRPCYCYTKYFSCSLSWPASSLCEAFISTPLFVSSSDLVSFPKVCNCMLFSITMLGFCFHSNKNRLNPSLQIPKRTICLVPEKMQEKTIVKKGDRKKKSSERMNSIVVLLIETKETWVFFWE